jgi:hypothetical protein
MECSIAKASTTRLEDAPLHRQTLELTEIALGRNHIVVNSRERRTNNLGRRKKTLFKRVYELGKYNSVDVALIIRQNGRFFI